ncbi:DEAD/DEAH box helicase, partial [Carboxydothermus islandicus]|uniref:DEAD/DEAH box helicase n=1 Tax=Carboxydothermus islandicus TaxID=661089 RepID=UPI00350E47E2
MRNFRELSEVQKKAIPLILANENLTIIAPTASGKTEAVIVPIAQKIFLLK